LYVKRPDSSDSLALPLPSAEILAVSHAGEMLLALSCVTTHNGTCAGTLAQTPMAGGAPREMQENVQDADWAPDGTTFALVRDVTEGAQLEFPAGKILYKTSGHISYPRISPKGDRIAFFDHPARIDDAGSVAVVDLAGKKATLAGPFKTAQGLAWSPDGSEVWYTATPRNLTRGLYAVSLSARTRAIATVAGSLTLRDISKGGSVLLSQDVDRLSAHVTGPEEGTDRDISWLDWTLAVDLSEDGKTALLEEEGGDGGAYMAGLRPTDGSAIVRLRSGSASGLSYDGKWTLLRAESDDTLLVVPTGPGESMSLPPSRLQQLLSISWFPDGKHILFAGVEAGHGPRLYDEGIPAGSPRPITPEGFLLAAMTRAVSPDGRFALAVGADDGITWIWPLDGGAPRRFDAVDPKRERPVRWTADGHGIYVREWKVLPFQIFLYSLTRKLSDLYVVDGLR
jgi:hypothetical protein